MVQAIAAFLGKKHVRPQSSYQQSRKSTWDFLQRPRNPTIAAETSRRSLNLCNRKPRKFLVPPLGPLPRVDISGREAAQLSGWGGLRRWVDDDDQPPRPFSPKKQESDRPLEGERKKEKRCLYQDSMAGEISLPSLLLMMAFPSMACRWLFGS